ncbi:hypothetical protein SUGI_0825410 [Cryptomeria japonica]|nr:hypothetical protein SUGI_0825410 [Cryptomeria japonica]
MRVVVVLSACHCWLLLLFQGTVRMEHQNLINDHSKKIVSSGISGSDGHKDAMLDLRSLALGQLLWVRGFKCSWWPAQVVDEKNISENIIVNDRIEGGVLVRFYGSYTYAWVDPFADLCKFRESFIENGSDHVKAFQKSLGEILLHIDVNKSSVQVDGMHKNSATSSQCNMSGGGEEPEKSQRQRKLKEKVTKTAKHDEAEQTSSQGKQKEVPKRGKVEETEKTQSLGKTKEKTPKSVKGGEPEQIQAQGKRKTKVLEREKGQKPVQIESEEKRKEKAPKAARSEEPEQIQSKGKRKSAEGEVEIESQGKGKGKIPKNVTDREFQSQGKRKENAIKCAKGEESEQTERKGKKNEKASSDGSQRSRGKTKEKVPYNAQDVREHGSEKTVRQIKLMRQLGLAAPAGSPFGV